MGQRWGESASVRIPKASFSPTYRPHSATKLAIHWLLGLGQALKSLVSFLSWASVSLPAAQVYSPCPACCAGKMNYPGKYSQPSIPLGFASLDLTSLESNQPLIQRPNCTHRTYALLCKGLKQLQTLVSEEAPSTNTLRHWGITVLWRQF